MADRVARAINLLGADCGFLETTDSDAILELIEDKVDDVDQGNHTRSVQPINYYY